MRKDGQWRAAQIRVQLTEVWKICTKKRRRNDEALESRRCGNGHHRLCVVSSHHQHQHNLKLKHPKNVRESVYISFDKKSSEKGGEGVQHKSIINYFFEFWQQHLTSNTTLLLFNVSVETIFYTDLISVLNPFHSSFPSRVILRNVDARMKWNFQLKQKKKKRR